MSYIHKYQSIIYVAESVKKLLLEYIDKSSLTFVE